MINKTHDMRSYLNDKKLGQLLNPMDVTEFFDDYWGQYPVKLETGGSFGSILHASDIDRIVRQAGVNIRLVKQADGGTQIRDLSTVANSPNLYELYKAWSEGFSIAVEELLLWPRIAEFRQHMEAVTHYRNSSTLFLTPPGAQCFPPHYDGHEALVLQVEGSKDWTVWPRMNIGKTLGGEEIDDPGSLPTPVMEVTLNAGDVLYLPRGYPHQAKAAGERSLHLTLQIYPPSYRVFREHLLAVARHLKLPLPENLPKDFTDSEIRPELNEYLPVSFLDTENLGSELLEWFEPEILEPLVENVRGILNHELSIPGQPVLLGYFGYENRIGNINASTILRKRNLSICTTGIKTGHSWLRFHKLTVNAKPEMLPAFQFIVDTDCFRVSDLPGTMPDPAKREIIMELVRAGLLAIEDSP